jgi:hypothetical protein
MNTHVPASPSDGGLLAHLSRSLRRGSAKWTAAAGWTDRDGLALPPILFVVHCATALERWRKEGDKNVVEHKTEHPLPDPEALNAAIPMAEWKLGLNGQPEKPWKLIYIVVMIDTAGGAIYTYKNSTYGTLLMYEQLEERIAVTGSRRLTVPKRARIWNPSSGVSSGETNCRCGSSQFRLQLLRQFQLLQ